MTSQPLYTKKQIGNGPCRACEFKGSETGWDIYECRDGHLYAFRPGSWQRSMDPIDLRNMMDAWEREHLSSQS